MVCPQSFYSFTSISRTGLKSLCTQSKYWRKLFPSDLTMMIFHFFTKWHSVIIQNLFQAQQSDSNFSYPEVSYVVCLIKLIDEIRLDIRSILETSEPNHCLAMQDSTNSRCLYIWSLALQILQQKLEQKVSPQRPWWLELANSRARCHLDSLLMLLLSDKMNFPRSGAGLAR